jgi:hypothetical protein
MTLFLKILLVVALEAGLAYFAFFLVERTFAGALKAIKLALKFEFTTDTGKMNFIGVVILTFLTIFFSLHEMFANALSTEKPPPSDLRVLAPLVLFGLVFVISVICVLLMERQRSHPED